MLRYLFLLISYVFVVHANGKGRPESRTNTYEILGGTDLGVLIPVADYQFKGRSQASDPVVWLNVYENIENSNLQFTLIFDPLDGPTDVETFAKWCLINDNFMGMRDFLDVAEVKRREELTTGKNKDIPTIRFVSEYKDLFVDQLFFTVGNYGYCILATYPKEESSRSIYWDSFFRNTLPWIDASR
ncbi:MAG TPA: hypothetical protein VLE89_00885 [Chlamydiales bacterium]|nr:hypothetical protein [Chlamydiales bacterium]